MLGESTNSDNKTADFLETQHFCLSDYYTCVTCDIVDGSCRLRPVWRYNKAIFRPADTFSTLRDVRQAWRAMYGLGIQPYLFRIPERFQKFRNQKYYLEIEFRKITNVFGLKVAGSSSQLQWGAVTRFSLYHKRKDSEPWQGYVDRLNQPRVRPHTHRLPKA